MGIWNLFKSNRSRALSTARVQVVSPICTAGVVDGDKATEIKVMDNATYMASDDKAWLRYLSQPLRTYRKPGLTMKEEFDLWTADRQRRRAQSDANNRQSIRA